MKKKLLFTTLILSVISGNGFADNTWTKKKDFSGTARWGSVGFSIGSKGFVCMGVDGSMRTDLWEYDAAGDAWTQKADFKGVPRYQATAFSIGDKAYVGMGSAGSAFPFSPVYKDMWEYSSADNKWTQKKDFDGPARFGTTSFSIGNKGYMGTGFIDSAPYFLKDFWEYDPAGDKWTRKKDFGGTERMEAAGFVINGKGYIGTGGNYGLSNPLFKDLWEFDPTKNSWTQKKDFGGVGRSLGVGFAIGGRGYIGIGGDFSSQSYQDFWEYNPSTNEWTNRADFGGAARWLTACFAVNGNGYVVAGGNFSPTFKDVWQYTPDASASVNEKQDEVFSVKVTAFPNPSDSKTTFTVSGPAAGHNTLKIYDITGKLVTSKEFTGNKVVIARDEIGSGVYLYSVTSGNNTQASGKIIFH